MQNFIKYRNLIKHNDLILIIYIQSDTVKGETLEIAKKIFMKLFSQDFISK